MQPVAFVPQDWLLNAARKERRRVQVYLVSGARSLGTIKSFDNLVVLLNTNGVMHAIYKHAITSVQLEDLGGLARKRSESDPKAPVVVVRKRRPIRD